MQRYAKVIWKAVSYSRWESVMQPNLFFQYLPKNSFWCPKRLFEQSLYYPSSNHSLMPMLSDVTVFYLLTTVSLPLTLSSMTNFKAQSLVWIYLSISWRKVIFFLFFTPVRCAFINAFHEWENWDSTRRTCPKSHSW